MAPTRCVVGGTLSNQMNLTGNGGRTQISILAGGLLDVDDVERIEIKGQGEFQDNVIINDLSGTDVKQVAIILSGTGGLSDNVLLVAGAGNDAHRGILDRGHRLDHGIAR